ncbi:MAG: YlxR family protein [Firmicutes bacterium]|nr:YlxR family protein [Bacillota bacterium]
MNKDNAGKLPPMRRCAGCGKSRPKQELVRVVYTGEGLKADPASRLDGRGVYVCRNAECVENAVKRNGFARTLRRPVSKDELDSVRAQLTEIICG